MNMAPPLPSLDLIVAPPLPSLNLNGTTTVSGFGYSGDGDPGVLDHDLVGTSKDLLQLLVVQPEGKSRMNADAWINGAHLVTKARLGT